MSGWSGANSPVSGKEVAGFPVSVGAMMAEGPVSV